ncbi:KamA family radical SAM protein [Ruminococcaceae bacterium OttesenSCG-928-I18]|nr:KamA family radical SAM protein [Ruminococcaceae bacterium OttesenSCG-928-I18]
MNKGIQLKDNICKSEDLPKESKLSAEERKRMDEILAQFPMSITPYYLSLIDFDDPEDPIRKMAIPSVAETDLSGSFDTSGEANNTVIAGMQHKYPQSVMILSTNQCAMYCRHCFRKRLVGLSGDEVARHFGQMRDYISEHKEINNALISGGDALLNSNERLGEILSMLVKIPHLDTIRIASRVPVVYPTRITEDEALVQMLARYNREKQLTFVTQYNHARELTELSLKAIRQIQHAGIPVKNQTVLLKGVNDDTKVLAQLLHALVAAGIHPYYIFQCRPVSGVKNQFQVPLGEGYEIVRQAKKEQSGLGKCFRYCMSHVTGKLEILGPLNGEMLFKYHEAQDARYLGRMFTKRLRPGQAWLDEETLIP